MDEAARNSRRETRDGGPQESDGFLERITGSMTASRLFASTPCAEMRLINPVNGRIRTVPPLLPKGVPSPHDEGVGKRGVPTAWLLHGQTPHPNPLPARPSGRGSERARPVVLSRCAPSQSGPPFLPLLAIPSLG